MHTTEPRGQSPAATEPLPWAYGQQAVASVDEPRVSRSEVLRSIAVTSAMFVALGCLAAWLWSIWAEPAHFVVTRDNAVMDELEAGRQFGTDVVYGAIAVVGGLAAGSVLGWRHVRAGWVLAVVTAVAAGVAALIAWRLGIVLGPPAPQSVLGDARVGDVVPERLDVHARGLLLLWPIASLAGLIASVAAFDSKIVPRDPPGR